MHMSEPPIQKCRRSMIEYIIPSRACVKAARCCVNCRIWSVLVLKRSPYQTDEDNFDEVCLIYQSNQRFKGMGGSGALSMVAVSGLVQQGNWRVQSR